MEIVLATRNLKKVEEINRILGDMEVTLLTLNDFPSCPEVEEDADTFEGNASKKAVEIARCTGKTALADDSGLEVYALDNAPGIRSARYAGDNAKDIDNINKLLSEMDRLPDDRRGCRFVCCIALAFPDGEVIKFSGFAEGSISREMHGRMGFGYDPVFYPAGHTRTFAEMSPGEKDALSHRRAALEKLKSCLKILLFKI
ncbi:MAG: RdgB/HAM1 family non-canonical purine NTP pyrophosphatase [Nitrospirae bacterium]|nr:RdgB/HAM1 family non-canonical purine NTP pyrophosphatase [Nitrospirota bacterium]MCL5238015.1 RdgB/HAM1 family non-canonical purine NTP pyrophosphatase [Nitrospirota bacterium]